MFVVMPVLDSDIARGVAERGVAVEINGRPGRLDLDDWHCKLARDIGANLVVATGAHGPVELGVMRFAVDQARRGGWLEHADLVNTRDLAGLREALRR